MLHLIGNYTMYLSVDVQGGTNGSDSFDSQTRVCECIDDLLSLSLSLRLSSAFHMRANIGLGLHAKVGKRVRFARGDKGSRQIVCVCCTHGQIGFQIHREFAEERFPFASLPSIEEVDSLTEAELNDSHTALCHGGLDSF